MNLNMRKIIILGGGTFSPIRSHLALSAPAFGTVAKQIHSLIGNSELVLTKMADSNSSLVTNQDVSDYIDSIIKDKNIGVIFFSIAMCDFKGHIGNLPSGSHAERLDSSKIGIQVTLSPQEKVIDKIRRERPDIFLVGFKTTSNASEEDQFKKALKMMKKSKCNLVLANDVATRNNMIITPEESIYGNTTDRDSVIKELVQMTLMRGDLTYNPTDFQYQPSFEVKSNTSENFQKVLRYVVENNGYIENNGNGFTPGHFCYKCGDNSFYSSQRKANHNLVFKEGMTKVIVSENKFVALGERKPSVGARSQWLILQENPNHDCIIHTHNPLREGSDVPVAEQKPFQCGSLECGINTRDHMQDFDGIKAVYLKKHGINMSFSSKDDPNKIINFIDQNIVLGKKVK